MHKLLHARARDIADVDRSRSASTAIEVSHFAARHSFRISYASERCAIGARQTQAGAIRWAIRLVPAIGHIRHPTLIDRVE